MKGEDACIVVLGTLVLACSATQKDDGGETDADSTGQIDLPSPDFLEPANGELVVATDRTQDITLDVHATPGVTQLLIDEQSVGVLDGGSAFGELDAQSLRLYVRGALVAGVHTLSLRTPDAIESESSEKVSVFVEGVSVPTWAYEPGDAVVATGDALVLGPTHGAALGLVVDEDLGSSLVVWPPDADGWDTGAPRMLALPGHAAAGADAMVAIERRGTDDEATLRAAWTTGRPGDGIAVVEVDWVGDDDGTVRTGFAPDAAWLGTREWSAIGRPMLTGALVLAEVAAYVDTEQPHPGDAVLAFTPFDTLGDAPPQRLPLGTVDLDRTGPVLESLPMDAAAIGVRIDHSRPAVLEVADTAALTLRPTTALVDDPDWGDVEGPLVTVTGAFGSRHVAGLHRDRDAIVLGWFDDVGGNPASIRTVALPDDGLATGAPAVALLDGAVVVLVPRGEAEVVAIGVGSSEPGVRTLAGAMCDQLAAPLADVGNTDARVELACLRARELTIGVLRPDDAG